MGWEKRGNNKYYYQKRRINKRVYSVYIGRSETAELIAKLDEITNTERASKRLNLAVEREQIRQIDKLINDLSDANKCLVDALYLINGFHQHKRQWRKIRK